MVSHISVLFQNQLPSLEAILVNLKESTGLNNLQFTIEDNIADIENPFDPTDGVSIYHDDNNMITTTVFHSRMSYLLGATLNVLVDLGGKYDYSIPKWTKKRWDDVKNEVKKLRDIPYENIPNWKLPEELRD